MKRHVASALFLMSGLALAETEAKEKNTFDWGIDVRARYDFTGNLPKKQNGQGDESDYLRFRTRVWGKATFDKLTIFGRLADEFRYYRAPHADRDKQKFPDVLFIDSLYIQLEDLPGDIDLKVGRQDIKLGAGRIFSDGTGGDGSRSAYFDAARLTWHYGEASTLDTIVLYIDDEDIFPTLGKTHSSANVKSDYAPTGYATTEAGAALYLQHREYEDAPLDLYYVYKDESTSNKIDGRVSHTLGVRFVPKLTDTISAEIEAAGQNVNLDHGESFTAALLYGGVTYKSDWTYKPSFTAACLYLSGDEKLNHGWNPVFNRDTGIGETIAPMYDKYRYTNLLYPHLAINVTPAAQHKTTLELGPMFTPATEMGADSNYRGFFAKAKHTFPIIDHLTGAVQLEYLAKGDYFADNARDNAWFIRFELNFKF